MPLAARASLHRPERRDSVAASHGVALALQASPMPLYHRLYAILRSQIAGAVYRHGDLLPTEAALMQSFGVSRITAKRALDELSAEGLVERARGRGTMVTDRGAPGIGDAPITGSFEDLLQNLASIGCGTSVELLEFDYVPAPPVVAARLQLKDGLVQRAVRLRHADGRPISLLTTFIAEAIGRAFPAGAMRDAPVIELITRAGLRIASAEQNITATLADSVTAGRLSVHAGSPLLLVKRVLYDPAQRPLEYLEALYPPDRFEFRMRLPASRIAARTTRHTSPKGKLP